MSLIVPMKPTPNSDRMPTSPESNRASSLLAFGAHPDDIEFGCGAVVALETRAGRAAHLVVCSRGESATNGTPETRTRETEAAAALLGATLEFVELDGDAHLEIKTVHALKLAAILREKRPSIVLAPTLEENQHPDHARLGRLVRDATRLARYGGVAELRHLPPHSIDHLLFYAISPDAEITDVPPLLVDVSEPAVVQQWTAAMTAHGSQAATRNYVELQLTRARLHGLRAGVQHAVPLWSNDSLVVSSLSALERSARRF